MGDVPPKEDAAPGKDASLTDASADAREASTTDAADAADSSNDARDAADASDARDASDALDARDAADVTDSADALDAADASDALQCDSGALPQAYFFDGDGDGYGDANTRVIRCVRPGLDWVVIAGDCHDGNDEVRPNQTAAYGRGYVPARGGLVRSYDYNCDGRETGASGQAQAPAECPAIIIFCSGGGYAKSIERPALTGLNPYCGSNLYSTCEGVGAGCVQTTKTTLFPYTCN